MKKSGSHSACGGADRERRRPRQSLDTVASIKQSLTWSFDQMRDRGYRETVYRTVCEVLVNPDLLTYEVAVLVVGTDLETQRLDLELFGDISDLIIEEAKERLLTATAEVLDELTHGNWN